jgi:cellulose synthase/poly-beta-1,6-N-acetylglucosamine synthase-like glycosyltransferase
MPESIFELDYPKDLIEVIVIDAVSSDKTLQVAETYPVKAFSKQLNAPAAYNLAMKIASHEILGFVDADAKVERNWLKKLIPRLAEAKTAGVSGNIETWNAENLEEKHWVRDKEPLCTNWRLRRTCGYDEPAPQENV